MKQAEDAAANKPARDTGKTPAASAAAPPRFVKFATQADPEVIAQLRAIAQSEGRMLQTIVNEALEALVRSRQEKPRPDVKRLMQRSFERYDTLYKKLAE